MNDKIRKCYTEYRSKGSLITDYQMCKAYFGKNGNIQEMAELILKEKHPLYATEIKKKLMAARGKKDAVIVIPKIGLNSKVGDIISRFVKKNFEKMLYDQKRNNAYPLLVRDLLEKYS